MTNETYDFKKVFAIIEPLAYSHALVIVNRTNIVGKLVQMLGTDLTEEEKENNPNLGSA